MYKNSNGRCPFTNAIRDALLTGRRRRRLTVKRPRTKDPLLCYLNDHLAFTQLSQNLYEVTWPWCLSSPYNAGWVKGSHRGSFLYISHTVELLAEMFPTSKKEKTQTETRASSSYHLLTHEYLKHNNLTRASSESTTITSQMARTSPASSWQDRPQAWRHGHCRGYWPRPDR